METSLRTITAPAGIGDGIFLFEKIINTGEKFNFKIPDGSPQRGKQIYDLLPQLSESCTYTPNLTYSFINKKNIQNTKLRWNHIQEQEFYLSANSHVELGKRIEQFLPDLPTTYRLEYFTTDKDKQKAKKLLPNGQTYIGIYTSAYSNVRNWGAWGAKEWFELIQMLSSEKAVTFVLVGAEYDVGVTEDLSKAMNQQKIKFINTIGQPLPVVIEMMKRFSYFCGFPSGLSILNETLGKDGLMFYAPNIAGIVNTWADPGRIKAGNIKECLFCEPTAIYKWLKDVYLIHDKL